MTTDAEDRTTWPRNGQVIRRAELLRLIEENGGPQNLDLRGGRFLGDGREDAPLENPLDLSPEALAPLTEEYRQVNSGRAPPWLDSGGAIDLWGAQLQGASLRRAHLQEANLVVAGLQGADLWRAQLQGAHLRRARVEGADLRYAQLQRVDMYDVRSLDGAHWCGAFLDHTRIRRESLGKASGDELKAHRRKEPDEYHAAKEAYLLLKNNFNQTGRYEDASWAYVEEQQMEKMALHWEWRSYEWEVWGAWGSLWRWLRNWAYELLTGYGERVYMPLIWALVVIAVFAAIYAGAGNIATGDVGGLQGQATHSPVTALVHSISAFATIGFNTLEPQGWGARLLTAVEAMCGIGLFALFVFTIGNRMSRG